MKKPARRNTTRNQAPRYRGRGPERQEPNSSRSGAKSDRPNLELERGADQELNSNPPHFWGLANGEDLDFLPWQRWIMIRNWKVMGWRII